MSEVPPSLSRNLGPLIFWALFILSGFGSIFWFGSIVAQASLGGTSFASVNSGRRVIWFWHFPLGWLFTLAAIFFLAKATNALRVLKAFSDPSVITLIIVGLAALSVSLFFQDVAYYHSRHPEYELSMSVEKARALQRSALALALLTWSLAWWKGSSARTK